MSIKSGCNKGKRAQMEIGFGVIFSIILIVVFISFAIFGIIKFLDTQSNIQAEAFKKKLQDDINSAYMSVSVSNPVKYDVPRNVQKVCFIRDRLVYEGGDLYENMYFVPERKYDGALLKNIDIIKILSNPESSGEEFCVSANSGKIAVTLKKSSGDTLVTITK